MISIGSLRARCNSENIMAVAISRVGITMNNLFRM